MGTMGYYMGANLYMHSTLHQRGDTRTVFNLVRGNTPPEQRLDISTGVMPHLTLAPQDAKYFLLRHGIDVAQIIGGW